MINIRVENEYSKLEKVVLGIAYDFGPPPKINDCYDPKTRLNVINNSLSNRKPFFLLGLTSLSMTIHESFHQ